MYHDGGIAVTALCSFITASFSIVIEARYQWRQLSENNEIITYQEFKRGIDAEVCSFPLSLNETKLMGVGEWRRGEWKICMVLDGVVIIDHYINIFSSINFLLLYLNNYKELPFQKQLLQMFCKTGFLKILVRFTEKYLCQSLLVN